MTMAFLNKLAKKELEKYAYTHRVIVGTSIGKTQITHGGGSYFRFIFRLDERFGLDASTMFRLQKRTRQSVSRN